MFAGKDPADQETDEDIAEREENLAPMLVHKQIGREQVSEQRRVPVRCPSIGTLVLENVTGSIGDDAIIDIGVQWSIASEFGIVKFAVENEQKVQEQGERGVEQQECHRRMKIECFFVWMKCDAMDEKRLHSIHDLYTRFDWCDA